MTTRPNMEQLEQEALELYSGLVRQDAAASAVGPVVVAAAPRAAAGAPRRRRRRAVRAVARRRAAAREAPNPRRRPTGGRQAEKLVARSPSARRNCPWRRAVAGRE